MPPCFARLVEPGLVAEVVARLGPNAMDARRLRTEFGLDCTAAARGTALSCQRRFAARMSCSLHMMAVPPMTSFAPWRSGVHQVDIQPSPDGSPPVVSTRLLIDPHPAGDNTCPPAYRR